MFLFWFLLLFSLETAHSWIALGPEHSLGKIQTKQKTIFPSAFVLMFFFLFHVKSVFALWQRLWCLDFKLPWYKAITRSHTFWLTERCTAQGVLVIFITSNWNLRFARVYRLYLRANESHTTPLRWLFTRIDTILYNDVRSSGIQWKNYVDGCNGSRCLYQTFAAHISKYSR